MNRSTHHSTSGRCAVASSGVLLATAFVLACLLPLPAYPASIEKPYFRAGLCNSPTLPLSVKQLQTLLDGLCLRTGFLEMRFDEDGFLTLGDRTRIAGGSALARELVIAAVHGRDSFRLESHQQSPSVAFAGIRPTEDYVDGAGTKHEIWSLKLDFYDFAQLRGGAEALAAFDPAINLLHELGHGVLKLQDSISETDPLGDCERHNNRIRRELGLAERQNYEPRNQLAVTPESTAQCLLGEVVFVRTEVGKRDKKVSLFFNTERVSMVMKARPQSVRRAGFPRCSLPSLRPIVGRSNMPPFSTPCDASGKRVGLHYSRFSLNRC